MNVYEMEGFLRGKCLPGDMKVNESDAQYLVRKFSELQSQNADMSVHLANAESKCMELAVENSAIKVMNDCLSEEMRGYESDGAFEGPKMHLLWWKAETPATDAFLAEVRAQGVEMFALMFAEEAIKDNNITTGWKARASRAASEYAELLREGADK